MNIFKLFFIYVLCFSKVLIADDFFDRQAEIYNIDVNEDGTQFVKNWQTISQSILKEIEKINLMNETDYNRIPEKQFLTLIKNAVASYPQTLLSLERKKESESNLDLAKSAQYPKIDFGAGSGEQSTEYPTGTIDGSQDRLTLSLSQLVYDFNQTKLTIEAAQKKIRGAEFDESATKLDNCMTAIQSYLEYFRSSALLSLAIKQTESAQAFVLMLSEKEKLGGTSNHEISRAKIKYAEALNKIPLLEQKLLVSKSRFEMFFSTTKLDPQGVFYPVEPNVNLLQEIKFDNLFSNYPVVKSIRESMDAAIIEIEVLNKSKYGGFYLEGSAAKVSGSLSTSAQDSESIMLTYRSNLFSGGSHKAKISGAKAKLAQQKLQLEQIEKDYRLALHQAKSLYVSEQKTFISTKEIVEQSMLSYKGTLELFLARKGGLLDVFSLQESIFDAGSLMVNSFVNKTLAKYRYMHITGQLLEYVFPKI